MGTMKLKTKKLIWIVAEVALLAVILYYVAIPLMKRDVYYIIHYYK